MSFTPTSSSNVSLKIRQAPLHEHARNRLREMIVRGILPPGTNIDEAELCASLGISRTPLREALKLLASEGLVRLEANRGAFVVPVQADEIADLFEVVARLEQWAAQLAAVRGSPDDLATLRRLQKRMEGEHRAQHRAPYFELNQVIHRAIVAMSGNQPLIAVHDMLFARVERVRFLAIGSRARWDESIHEHQELLSALEARDSRRAGLVLAKHVRRTGELMREVLKPQTSDHAREPHRRQRSRKSMPQTRTREVPQQ
jgi:DNA-binding GntR family transcriptional regulator